jgi:hypothetical protein
VCRQNQSAAIIATSQRAVAKAIIIKANHLYDDAILNTLVSIAGCIQVSILSYREMPNSRIPVYFTDK